MIKKVATGGNAPKVFANHQKKVEDEIEVAVMATNVCCIARLDKDLLFTATKDAINYEDSTFGRM